jgi:hypothetical protein
MRGRSLCVGTWLLLSVMLGCAPTPSPSPSLTPPPIPAEFVPWPDIVWTVADLPPLAPDISEERAIAVTASDAGFVAVGYREADGLRNGAIWHSPDGATWDAVEDAAALARVELVDVTTAPGGFVALGIESLDDDNEHPVGVAFGSPDGRSWSRLGPLAATGESYAASIAGGPDGVLAVGSDATGAAALWRSTDGRVFERLVVSGPAAGGVIDPQVIDGGFIALGPDEMPPSVLSSADGRSWTSTTIDPGQDLSATRLVGARWGTVVLGIFAPGCSEGASCSAQSIAWWSTDRTVWGRLPVEGSPVSNGGSTIVPAGEHGVLAIDGASAWASPDGWAWRPLPEPGDGSIVIDDAVVRSDAIVAVGEEFREVDGVTFARIVVALPGGAG